MKPNSWASLLMLFRDACIHWVKLWPVDKCCKRDKTEGVQQKKKLISRGSKRGGERKKDRWIAKQRSKIEAKKRKTLTGTLITEDRSSSNLCLSGWSNQRYALEQIKVSYRCRQLRAWWMAVKNKPCSAANSLLSQSDRSSGRKTQPARSITKPHRHRQECSMYKNTFMLHRKTVGTLLRQKLYWHVV